MRSQIKGGVMINYDSTIVDYVILFACSRIMFVITVIARDLILK